ncbi:DUF443 family protein [Lentibacillus daqui]|uniref:DUF443 family protein n=1 Tax=Lentibacillus daqui TaxID=2911514 RepID=UPI0022B15BBB|nr:DUF443 family protein [Lentibacillus daqui]
MKCKVQGAYKNIRYRILTINGEDYIMDMGRSLWKIIFPFFYWMLPNPVYKVNEPNIVGKLKSPEVNQKDTGNSGPISAGIGIFIATMLRPLGDILALPDNTLVNSVILSLLVISVIVMIVTINYRCKKKLQKVVGLEQLPKSKLWIRPQSFKHFSQILFTYLIAMVSTLALCYLSIVASNVITLLFTIGSLGFLYIVHVLTAGVGQNTVKFKGVSKVNVVVRERSRFN